MDIDPEKGGRGPVETIDLDFVKGRTYRVLACEVTEDEEFKTCNKVEFDHTGQGSFFPTYGKCGAPIYIIIIYILISHFVMINLI